ncbi:hypothetical protein DMENIID0001_122170 [Sergentomyia squamirostris]
MRVAVSPPPASTEFHPAHLQSRTQSSVRGENSWCCVVFLGLSVFLTNCWCILLSLTLSCGNHQTIRGHNGGQNLIVTGSLHEPLPHPEYPQLGYQFPALPVNTKGQFVAIPGIQLREASTDDR